MVTISTDRFYYDKEDRSFVEDASGLPTLNLDHFRLKSQWTGRSVEVALSTTRRDGEDEIIAWVFRPVRPEERSLFTVHVLND